LEFVTFHVSLAGRVKIHPNQTLKDQEYLSMISMMCASARLFHPEAEATVLSDRNTRLEKLPATIQPVRFDIDFEKLMLERTRVQCVHVERSPFSMPMVILDSDILINDALHSIFDHDFDVAVTWRKNKSMPINGGFMVLNNVRPEAAKRFFSQFYALYRERYAGQEHAAWFGDQLALRDLIGLSMHEMNTVEIVDVAGCRVLLLPCEVYNFSPVNKYRHIAHALSGKTVLHFKGERKRLMRPYWKAWLSPRRSFSPLAWLEGWAMRRWLRRQITMEASR